MSTQQNDQCSRPGFGEEECPDQRNSAWGVVRAPGDARLFRGRRADTKHREEDMEIKKETRRHRQEMQRNQKKHAAFLKHFDARVARLFARIDQAPPAARKEAA